MKRLCLVALLVALLLPTAALADAPVWRTYSNANWVNDSAIAGDYLWAATDGGAVRWNLLDGTYTKYTTASGLADNVVNAVAVGSDGSVWFGTPSGISRLLGTTWTRYTRAAMGTSGWYSLRSAEGLAIGADGTVWAAISGGVAKFDGSAWSVVTDAGGDHLQQTRAVAVNGADKWFITSDGVLRLNGSTVTTYTHGTSGGLADDRPQDIAVDAAGHVWVAYFTGVSEFDGSTWQLHDGMNTPELGAAFLAAVESAPSGGVWFGGDSVIGYEGGVWTSYPSAGLGGEEAQAISCTASGSCWFGTNSAGLAEFDGSVWGTTLVIANEQPPCNSIDALTVDHTGTKWFGSLDGVSTFDGSTWDSDGSLPARALYTDRDGNVWMATGSIVYEIRKWNGTAWTIYDSTDGVIQTQTYCIFQDSHGVMWFGTYGGVNRFDGTTWSTITTADGLAHDYVRDIYEDGAGNLWFATGGGGVSRLTGAWNVASNWTTFNKANSGLSYDWVYCVVQDNAGALWFGTGGELNRLASGVWTSFGLDDGLGLMGVSMVSDIAIDGDGTLWLATGGGLAHYNGAHFVTWGTSYGLASLDLTQVAIDADGHLWLTSSGGITEITALPYEPVTFVPLLQKH